MSEKCVISDVEFKESSIHPVILNFGNGVLQPGHEDSLACRIYKDKKRNTLVAAATEKMVYSGSVKPDDLYNTFIGIRNTKTNKMRLVAVQYALLSPHLTNEECPLNISLKESEVTTADLKKQFGSKRAIRHTEQQERMKMDIENVREQLEKTAADVRIEESDIVDSLVTNDADSSYRPPLNRDADNIEKVYALNELISEEVLASIAKEVKRIGELDDEEVQLTPFIAQEFKKLSKSSGDTSTKRELFLYIQCLIKFMTSPARVISGKKYSPCGFSNEVHNDILQKFTLSSSHGRLRPTTMRDKCLCYILVLTMLACGYTLNLETLAKELKIGIKRLQEISRILAFSVSKNFAYLKLPLPAPVSNVKRGAKKKKF